MTLLLRRTPWPRSCWKALSPTVAHIRVVQNREARTRTRTPFLPCCAARAAPSHLLHGTTTHIRVVQSLEARALALAPAPRKCGHASAVPRRAMSHVCPHMLWEACVTTFASCTCRVVTLARLCACAQDGTKVRLKAIDLQKQKHSYTLKVGMKALPH